MADYSASEMMVAAARQLRDGQVMFVGIGLPPLAAILAKRTHAPRAVLLCESGIVDGDPARLPLSVPAPALVDVTAGGPMAPRPQAPSLQTSAGIQSP